jgi:hypothetical protein
MNVSHALGHEITSTRVHFRQAELILQHVSASLLLALLFYPEDGEDVFLRNA